jgi:stage II sporulation protein AB (anti-sigma F factor)
VSENCVELDIPSRLDLVAVARMVVAAVASCLEALDGDRLDDLRWVTSEATTNAIQANMETDVPGRVRLKIVVDEESVQLTVTDQGAGMAAATVVPEITHPDRLDVEGGFGIPLMQLLSTSDVVFDSTIDGTTVHMELRQ